MQVALVGAGIVGMVAAWKLARRGHRVILIDRGPIPNPESASFDQHRLLHDFESSLGASVTLVRASLDGWSELWRDLGCCFLVPAPVLAFSTVAGDLADRSVASSAQEATGYEVIERAELQRRYPQFNLTEVRFGVASRTGGLILANRLLLTLAERLRALDVALVPGAVVSEIDPAQSSLVIENGTSVAADCIIVTAGAWVRELVPKLRRRCWAQRQVTVFPIAPKHLGPSWNTSPIIVDFGGDQGLWLAPPLGGTELKLAASCYARPGDPASPADRAIANDEGARVLGHFAQHLKDAALYGVSRIESCFYSISVERRLIVEPVGAPTQPTWAICGCNGQGFKFAPLIADVIVGLVGQGASPDTLMANAGFAGIREGASGPHGPLKCATEPNTRAPPPASSHH